MEKNRIKLEKAEYNDIRLIKKIYKEAFPKNERKPFSIIRKLNRSGKGSLEKITLDGKICGFFFTVFMDELALVDYFAIQREHRNQGIGEIAIEALSEKYSDRRIFLEIEDPSSSEAAARRLGFYKRCGFSQTGTRVNLFGVDMELLTLGGFDVDFSTYFEFYVSMVGEVLASRCVKERK